jgi:uncharacterized protein DUF4136
MKFIGIVASLSILALSGFAQDIRSNYDRSADFSKYKTYKWVVVKDAPVVDELTERQLKQAFDAELARKGLTKTEAENADLLVAYQVAVTQEKQFSSYSTDFGYGPGWGRGWGYYGGGSTTTSGQTSTIHVGTVALDMYDSTHKQIVWRGAATKTLDAKANPEKRQKNIDKGVAKLLKKFPPEPKKS